MFAPHGACEWHIPSIQRWYGGYLGPWQPQLIGILNQAIITNRQQANQGVAAQLPEVAEKEVT